MTRLELTKRDFLKATTLAALGYGWSALGPASAFASAVRKAAQPEDPTWERVRDEFPLRSERVYFNNGTLGPSPTRVIAAVVAAMEEVEASGESREADDVALRAKLAEFVGVKPTEISLTHNTTNGVNIVAGGLNLSAGDEVVITTHEHVGGALPWLNRARLDGIVLKSFSPPETADGVLEKIESCLTDRTRVIAVPHLSCTTGQVFPIQEIAKLAAERGIFVFVDGAHGTGMFPLDLASLGVHFYASSTHKWLCGPKGVGYLYVREDMLERVEPRFVGAHSDTGWSLTTNPPRIEGFVSSAHRFDYGSQNTALYAGAIAAIDFFSRLGMDRVSEYGCGLATKLQSALLEYRDGVEVLTPLEPRSRGMIVTFRFLDPAKDSARFTTFASDRGFRIRQVPEAGLGAIRVSTHLYNTAPEVDRFVQVVGAFLSI